MRKQKKQLANNYYCGSEQRESNYKNATLTELKKRLCNVNKNSSRGNVMVKMSFRWTAANIWNESKGNIAVVVTSCIHRNPLCSILHLALNCLFLYFLYSIRSHVNAFR